MFNLKAWSLLRCGYLRDCWKEMSVLKQKAISNCIIIPVIIQCDGRGQLFYQPSCSCSAYSGHEKSRHMQKLLNKKGGKTSKKRWFEPHIAEPLESAAHKTKKGHSHRHMARVRQISHVLYDKITYVINSGELCQDLLEKQINITSVKVHKDMNGINVYWEADRSDWEDLEKMLDARSGKLRSLLISYHILGRIPPVTFVKAKQMYNMSQLSHLLEAADYGPDYIPGQTPKELQNLQESEKRENAIEERRQFSMKEDFQNQTMGELRDSLSYAYNEKCHSECSVSEHDLENVQNFGEKESDVIHDSSPAKSRIPSVKSLEHDTFFTNDNEELSDPSFMNELNFRSDLYGLRRDDIMKKVNAKKKGLSITENTTEESQTALPSFNLGSVFQKNMVLNKAYLKNKSRKEESKMKDRLLEREVSDFF